MQGSQLHPENFIVHKKVPQISARVGRAGVYRTLRVDGRKIIAPFAVADIDNAFAGVHHAVPRIAGRQYAVEHIDTPRNAFQNVFRRTDAHQVTRLVFGQNGGNQFRHGIHIFCRFADGEPADSIAFPLERGDGFGRYFAQFRVGAALYNREKGLLITVHGVRIVKSFDAARQPAVGEFHRLFGIIPFAGVRRTLVESHNDIGANHTLYIHHTFRGKVVFGAIDMALKRDAFFFDLAPVRQRMHLVSAAIRQDRPLPAVELMQSACFLQHLQSGPQVQVVGIAEAYLRLDVVAEFVLVYGFYRGGGADGHEYGGFDRAMVGLDEAGAGGGVGVGMS